MTLQSIKSQDGENKTLYQEQIELNDIEETKRRKEALVRDKADRVSSLQRDLEGMRTEVERTRRRAELINLKNLYSIKFGTLEIKALEAERNAKQVR